MSRRSPTHSGSTGSRYSAGPAAARTRSPAPRCCPAGSPGPACSWPGAVGGRGTRLVRRDGRVQRRASTRRRPPGREPLAASLAQAAGGIKADPASHGHGVSGRRCQNPTGGSWPTPESARCSRRTSRRRCGISADGWIRRHPGVLLAVGFRPVRHRRARAAVARRERRVLPGVARPLAGRADSRRAVMVEPGAAHFGALEVMPDMLAWLIAGRPIHGPAESDRLGQIGWASRSRFCSRHSGSAATLGWSSPRTMAREAIRAAASGRLPGPAAHVQDTARFASQTSVSGCSGPSTSAN